MFCSLKIQQKKEANEMNNFYLLMLRTEPVFACRTKAHCFLTLTSMSGTVQSIKVTSLYGNLWKSLKLQCLVHFPKAKIKTKVIMIHTQ